MNLTFRSTLCSPVRLIVTRKESSIVTNETDRRKIIKVGSFLKKKKKNMVKPTPSTTVQHLYGGNKVNLLTSHNPSPVVS